MQKLVFKAGDVARVVDHSIKAERQMPETIINDVTKTAEVKPIDVPAVVLMCDESGVYLMSNGYPPDHLLPEIKESSKRFGAYAERCNAQTHLNWRLNCTDFFGTEGDYAQPLRLATQMRAAIDRGAQEIIIYTDKGQLAISTRGLPKQ